jgi:hypothetical protein
MQKGKASTLAFLLPASKILILASGTPNADNQADKEVYGVAEKELSERILKIMLS